jgi:hypothetical protein
MFFICLCCRSYMLLQYRCLLMSTYVTCLEIMCIYCHKDFVLTVLFVCSILYYTGFICSIFVYFVMFTLHLCFLKKILHQINNVMSSDWLSSFYNSPSIILTDVWPADSAITDVSSPQCCCIVLPVSDVLKHYSCHIFMVKVSRLPLLISWGWANWHRKWYYHVSKLCMTSSARCNNQ